jgi:hypothetical protein
VVLTIWPGHEVFDAWIASSDRDRLTASDVHQAVSYQPITRYDVAGGYLKTLAWQPPGPAPHRRKRGRSHEMGYPGTAEN